MAKIKFPKKEKPKRVVATQDEKDARVDLTYRLLARRLTTEQVIQLVARFCAEKQRKPIDRKTIRWDYLPKAKRLIAINARNSREKQIAESMAFYEEIARDPKCPHSARVKAMNSIDKLMGLRAPERHQHQVMTIDFTKLFSPNGANGNGRPDLIEAQIKAIEAKEI